MSAPSRFPVSVTGEILSEAGVLLLKKEREEWELPGGKLDAGQSPEACLAREVREEGASPSPLDPSSTPG